MQRRLAAIFAADVVGYSRLMGQDEAGTLKRVKALWEELLQPQIENREGRIVKLMGDGLLAEFASVVEAAQCALDIQEQVSGYQSDVPKEQRMHLRIGINFGDVITEDGDVYGDGVNVAARLEKLAEPGGVCISAKVYEELESKLACSFEDLGEQSLKNIARPMRAYRMKPTSPVDGLDNAELSVPDKPSIAILPFDNMSADPEQEYFADGITEDIITQLSRFSWLVVIARNSSFHYKGQSPNLQDVGRELKVRYVLEGSVRRSANRVRINAQLIDTVSGDHIWAERFDRELQDVFAVQDEVSERVVSTVAGSLTRPNEKVSRRKHPSNLTAYELVLRGKEHLQRNTKNENLRAREMFQKAIDLEPEYGLAFTWLGWTHFYDFELGWSHDPLQSSANGLLCVRRAAELDAMDAWAQAGLAYSYSYARQYDLGELHIEKAVKLNPNDADILALKGLILAYLNRTDEGVEVLEAARERNPFALDWYLWCLGIALYTAGKYEQAIASWREMPNQPTEVVGCLAASYAKIGRVEDAQRYLEEFHLCSRQELAYYPQDNPEKWRQHWYRSFPYKDEENLDNLLDGLRKAGLSV